MNGQNGHASARENIPAYVLGALSVEEAAAVRAHVRQCGECARELQSYAHVPDALNLAAPEAPLPPGFTERLLERSDPRQIPIPALPSVEQAHRPRLPSRLPWALAAAAMFLALLLGGRTWQLERELDRRKAALDQRQATIASTLAVLGRKDVEARDLGVSASGIRTRLYQTENGEAGVLVFDGMPQPPEGKTYQLWLGEGQKWDSVATFKPNGNGNWFRVLQPSGGLAAYDKVCVSVEPVGGSEKPTADWSVYVSL